LIFAVPPRAVGKEKGWRLAAPELENSVVVSIRRILNDHATIATTLQEAGVSPAEIDSVLKAADAKSVLLESGPQMAPTIAELVQRVDLRKDAWKYRSISSRCSHPNQW
jgi:hypothetical protein